MIFKTKNKHVLNLALQIDFNIEKADLIQQPFIDWGTVRLTKANRTHYVGKGNFKILQEVNDNITVF